jgi:hypothetical protein
MRAEGVAVEAVAHVDVAFVVLPILDPFSGSRMPRRGCSRRCSRDLCLTFAGHVANSSGFGEQSRQTITCLDDYSSLLLHANKLTTLTSTWRRSLRSLQ